MPGKQVCKAREDRAATPNFSVQYLAMAVGDQAVDIDS